MRIDAVVAWVDGTDPEHRRKLEHWLGQPREGPKIVSKAAIPHRFASHDEIIYCLRSIRNHAPWIDTIWLVTDNQTPGSIDLKLAEELKLKVVDHTHLFREIPDVLPTFNSMAIESVLYRIRGLAEHFIYFNDDMFLANTIGPASFYAGSRGCDIVLRGRRVDWSASRPKNHHERAQYNAAKMIGADLSRVFSGAHMPHPLLRSVMLELSRTFAADFERNIALRFRTNTRFHPITLHNHFLLAAGRARTRNRRRTVYVTARQCLTADADELRAWLAKAEADDTLMVCINGFGDMLDTLPEAEARLAAIVGPAQPYEITFAAPQAVPV